MIELLLGFMAFLLFLGMSTGIILGIIYLVRLVQEVNALGEDVVRLTSVVGQAVQEMNNPRFMMMPKGMLPPGAMEPGKVEKGPTPSSGSYL